MESRDEALRLADRWRRTFRRARSWLRYGSSLRVKLVVLVLTIALLVVGALYGFAYVSLRSSIASIYVQRARSVAAVISKSIQEKEYILYYSDELDADISRLVERHEAVVGITVIGVSARGFLTVASTDPTEVGSVASEEEQDRFRALRSTEVTRLRIADQTVLRAFHPLFSGPDVLGVVVVDMSLAEQAAYVTRLSWQFGGGAAVGFLVLGGLVVFVLQLLVTQPVGRLAKAIAAVSARRYDVEIAPSSRRVPGTPLRDEIRQLIDGFNLMTKMIRAHEQELLKLVVLDELTGAYTFDHFRTELDRELSKTRRYGHATSVLVVELGGIEGRSDEDRRQVLIAAKSFLVRNLRSVDLLFRVGETRFASLLPETPPEGAVVAADRLRGLAPDITARFDFSLEVAIAAVGWTEDEAPSVDDALGRIVGPFGDLRG